MKKISLALLAAFMLFVTVQGAMAVTTEEQISAWLFDDDLIDSHGSNDLTNSGTTYATGKINNGLSMDDADYVTKTAPHGLNTPGDMTVSAWLYADDLADLQTFYEFGDGTEAENQNLFQLQIQTGGELRIFHEYGSGSNEIVTDSDFGFTASTWHHIVIVRNESSKKYLAYIDDFHKETLSYTNSYTGGSAATLRIGGNIFASDRGWDGLIDEVYVWNRTLNRTEISDLYNSGSGLQYDYNGTPASTVSTHTVHVTDLYDDTDAEGINVSFSSGDWNITDASGNAVVYNNTGSLTYTIGNASQYFNNGSGSVAENGTANAGIYSGYVNVTALSEKFTGTNIPSIGKVNSTGGKTYDRQISGINNIYLQNGTNTLTVYFNSTSDYYPLDFNVTINAPEAATTTVGGIYDLLFNISANDSITGASVSNFTVNASNASLGWTQDTTTTGTAQLELIQGYEWNFFIDAEGYAYQNVTLEGNSTAQAYEFSLLPTNSIFIFFFDETELTPILQNVTVTYTNGTASFNQTNSSGEMLLEGLAPGTWTLEAISTGYDNREYFVTVTARSTQTLDIYLLNSSLSGSTTFTIKDGDDGSTISAATMTMQQQVGANYVTLGQKISDVFGVAAFDLVQDEDYRFIIEATGYLTKQGDFTRTQGSYIVVLDNAVSQDFTSYQDDFNYQKTPSTVTATLTNFTLSVSSAEGKLEWFAVRVSWGNQTNQSNVTGSPSGGTAQTLANLTGHAGTVTATYWIKSTSFDDPFSITESWYLYDVEAGNYTFTSFMEYYTDDSNGLGFASRALLLTLAAVIGAAVLGVFFGREVAAGAASVVYIAGGYYSWLHWGIVIVIVSALIGSIIAVRGRV